MQIFARLTKIDEATRTVEGIIASEALDGSGEIFDYARSKPHFEKWSATVAKATDGKSLGNVRVMHGNVVAGITKQLDFDDDAGVVKVRSEIVDDNEWNKVLKGCYAGFSIGGRYVAKWDEGGKTRYEAAPNEYSLVDMPCNPEARFTVVKADGSSELRKFEHTTEADALATWYAAQSDDVRDTLAKIAKRPDVDAKAGADKYGNVTFADPANKKYPIDTPEHIRAAWNYIHKKANADKYSAKDADAIKARIVAAWKDKIDKAGPPEAQKMMDNELDKSADGGDVNKMMGEYSASDVHDQLDELENEHAPGDEDGLDDLDDARDMLGDDGDMAKGDFPGHPFRGNQYAGGSGSSARHRASSRAHQASKATTGQGNSKGAHENAAAKHDRASRSAARAGASKQAEYHKSMAAYHTKRAARFKKSADGDLAKSATTTEDDPMDAQLKKNLDAAQADLAKVSGERDELTKAVADRDELLVKAAAALDERNAVIAKFQNAPAPVKAALMAVTKGDDVGGATKDVEQVKKADGSVDEAATAIKKALMNPVMVR